MSKNSYKFLRTLPFFYKKSPLPFPSKKQQKPNRKGRGEKGKKKRKKKGENFFKTVKGGFFLIKEKILGKIWGFFFFFWVPPPKEKNHRGGVPPPPPKKKIKKIIKEF